MAGSTNHATRVEHNKLVDDVEALRLAFATLVTKLNADAGVTDTDYASVLAATLTGAKVADQDGVTT
jgi:hypothetical protein